MFPALYPFECQIVPQQLPTTAWDEERVPCSLRHCHEGFRQGHLPVCELRGSKDPVNTCRKIDGRSVLCFSRRQLRGGRHRNRLYPAGQELRADHFAGSIEKRTNRAVTKNLGRDAGAEERSSCNGLNGTPGRSDPLSHPLLPPAVFEMTELLHQHAGIDLDRACMLARAIARTSLDSVIFVFLQKCLLNGRFLDQISRKVLSALANICAIC